MTRNCPTCNIEIIYNSMTTLDRHKKYNKSCKECESTGNCSICNSPVLFKSGAQKRHRECKGTSRCENCKSIEREKYLTELKIWRSEHFKRVNEIIREKWRNATENEKEERSKKLSEHWKKAWKDPNSKFHTEKFKASRSLSGEKNGMFGKSLYDIWLEKYGKEEADIRKNKFSETQSNNTKGEKNPMYGKPSPCSGRGISGWYKDWYFRSTIELYYMINVIERFNIPWKNGECKELRSNYELDGVKRTYSADFLLNDKYLVECKPKHQQMFFINKIKREAAEKFCKENGYIYKMTRSNKYEVEEMLEMHEIGLIKIEDSKLKILLNQIENKK